MTVSFRIIGCLFPESPLNCQLKNQDKRILSQRLFHFLAIMSLWLNFMIKDCKMTVFIEQASPEIIVLKTHQKTEGALKEGPSVVLFH